MTSQVSWWVEGAEALEQTFIETWSDALKLQVMLQISQLVGTQEVTLDALEWIRPDVVSLDLTLCISSQLNLSLQNMLVRSRGINATKALIPLLYKEDGMIMVRWVKPFIKAASNEARDTRDLHETEVWNTPMTGANSFGGEKLGLVRDMEILAKPIIKVDNQSP